MNALVETYGRLTILSISGRDANGRILVNCRCVCGTEKTVRLKDLKSGNTTSCGCWRKEIAAAQSKRRQVHGCATRDKHVSAYRSWESMRSRCLNPNDSSYVRYGKRGITICPEWESFTQFLADMGERPPGTTLDRKRNNEGYYPDNCRWATPVEQGENRRSSKFFTYNGKTQTISAWAREFGIPIGTLWGRLTKQHLPINHALRGTK